jgi:hypothetical protein
VRWPWRRAPLPPEGVRLVYADGPSTDPLPVLYLWRQQGLDVWEVLVPPPGPVPIVGLQVDVWPGRTSLVLGMS